MAPTTKRNEKRSEYKKSKKAFKRACKSTASRFTKWIDREKMQNRPMPQVLFMYVDQGVIHYAGHPALVNGFENASETIKPIVDSSLLLAHSVGGESMAEASASTPEGNSERSLRDSDALNQNSFIQTLIHFGSQSVPVDHLKQTIANLATGGRHIKGFWLDIANRPRWWHPAVPFASPNGRPIQGEGRYITPAQVRKVGDSLRRYIQKGEHLSVAANDNATSEVSESDSIQGDNSEEDDENGNGGAEKRESGKKADNGEEDDEDENGDAARRERGKKADNGEEDDEDENGDAARRERGKKADNGEEDDEDENGDAARRESGKKADNGEEDDEDENGDAARRESGKKADNGEEGDEDENGDAARRESGKKGYRRSREGQKEAEFDANGKERRKRRKEEPDEGPESRAIDSLARRCKLFLEQLSKASSWKSFTGILGSNELLDDIMLTIRFMKQQYTVETLPTIVRRVDKRISKLKNLPVGMQPIVSTGDGDCLFNSVGIALFGTEEMAPVLRLGSILAATDHVQHFVEDYKAFITKPDDAYQFINNVSTPKVLEDMLNSGSKDIHEMILQTIQAEIMETAVMKSYSGILQIRFISCVIQDVVRIHNEELIEYYSGLVPPCRCIITEGDSVCDLLAVKSSVTNTYNHFVPLLSKRATRSRKGGEKRQDGPRMDTRTGRICGGSKKLGCLLPDAAQQPQVKCRRCHLYYHEQCAGVKVGKLRGQSKFQCCCLPEEVCMDFSDRKFSFKDLDRIRILSWTPRSASVQQKREERFQAAELSLFDVFSIHAHGITSQVIDFYVRVIQHEMLPSAETMVVAPHMIWLRIEGRKSVEEMSNIHRKIYPREKILDKELVAFPCQIRASWHWVLVVVSTKDGWIAVLDSLKSSADDGNRYIIATFMKYIKAVATIEESRHLPVFRPIGATVPQQHNGTDCGLMVLYNIMKLARREFHITNNHREIIVPGDFTVTDPMRLQVIKKMYELQ